MGRKRCPFTTATLGRKRRPPTTVQVIKKSSGQGCRQNHRILKRLLKNCTKVKTDVEIRRLLQHSPQSVGPSSKGPPPLSDVSTSHGRLWTSIPAAARDLWSKCLIHALASEVAHRDERSWVDILTMPALTLAGGPARGGGHHVAAKTGWTVYAVSCVSHRISLPRNANKIRAPTSASPPTFLTSFPLSFRMVPSGEHAQPRPRTAVTDELRVLHPRPRSQETSQASETLAWRRFRASLLT